MSRQTSVTDAKSDIYRSMARIGQAFASPQRLQMLSLLGHSSRTVEQLAVLTQQSEASASAHLKVLRSACLVETEKIGRHQHCRLASSAVSGVFLALRNLGEELLPELREVIDRFFADPESLSRFSIKELHTELRAGRVRVLDLRPIEEFHVGHLPGAISLPFSHIADKHTSLPSDVDLVAYCRGPYCLMALNGVDSLRAMGMPVRRLAFSVPEWQAAGYRVLRGA